MTSLIMIVAELPMPNRWPKQTMNAPNYWNLLGHLTKNGQERTVPITPTLRRELQRLRAQDGITHSRAGF